MDCMNENVFNYKLFVIYIVEDHLFKMHATEVFMFILLVWVYFNQD